jgi:hypothetical protein
MFATFVFVCFGLLRLLYTVRLLADSATAA